MDTAHTSLSVSWTATTNQVGFRKLLVIYKTVSVIFVVSFVDSNVGLRFPETNFFKHTVLSFQIWRKRRLSIYYRNASMRWVCNTVFSRGDISTSTLQTPFICPTTFSIRSWTQFWPIDHKIHVLWWMWICNYDSWLACASPLQRIRSQIYWSWWLFTWISDCNRKKFSYCISTDARFGKLQ